MQARLLFHIRVLPSEPSSIRSFVMFSLFRSVRPTLKSGGGPRARPFGFEGECLREEPNVEKVLHPAVQHPKMNIAFIFAR